MSGKILSIHPATARSDIFEPMTATDNYNPLDTMKTILPPGLAVVIALVAVVGAGSLCAQETNARPQRVGIYDSRAVAYAWFWSEAHQRQLREQMQSARAARAAGQTSHFQELDAALRQQQDEVHREVFSTAPATDALTAIQEQMPEIKRHAGVTALVSKWDDQSLKQYANAGKTDVTGQLVREFKPTEKQLKVIVDLQSKKPLSLEQCNELIRKGEI